MALIRWARSRRGLRYAAILITTAATTGFARGGEDASTRSDAPLLAAADFDALLFDGQKRSAADPFLAQPDSIVTDFGESELTDESVAPTQALTPGIGAALGALPTPFARRSPQQNRQSARATAALGLASVPFMIGDTSAGTCFSFRGITTVDIAHPTLTCSRLNVSENNTALPVDRFYYSYRHFHNATGLQVFQFQENFGLDVYTMGLEKTFWGGLGSVEVRVPVEHRLQSDMTSLIAPDFNIVDVLVGPQSEDREVDVGNLSFVAKLLLIERQALAVSAGLGVTVPTARDVTYDILVDDTITFPIAPGVTGETFSQFENFYENETVYLSPFLAWLFAPQSRWYHQGFLQFEVAANPSTLNTFGVGFTDFFFQGNPIGDVVWQTPGAGITQTDVFAQTLMRLNLGLGYQLIQPNARRTIADLKALVELHYTTTVQRSNISEIAIEQIGNGAFFPQSASAGNANGRADILNVAAGIAAQIGPFVVTNAVAAPIRRDPDRGFDFEYNMQIQLPF